MKILRFFNMLYVFKDIYVSSHTARLKRGHMGKIEPKGQLATRTLAMPKDTNIHGDIFGGWLLSQMDIAGSLVASKQIKSKVVTVAIDGMKFHEPVNVGDVVCCYGQVKRIGNSSIAVNIEAYVVRKFAEERTMVTEGIFTYVNIDQNGKPSPINEKYK